MAERTYMVVDPRRDHSFRIPRPDVSGAIGSPDACTLCHTDQSQEWAARTIADWYGPERRQELHYGEVLAAGREGGPEAMDGLIELVPGRRATGHRPGNCLEVAHSLRAWRYRKYPRGLRRS